MAKPVYYVNPAPTECDLTGEALNRHDDLVKTGEFVDGKTRFGPWANMCMTCHRLHGVGLGMGRGQHFKRQEDGRYLKVGG